MENRIANGIKSIITNKGLLQKAVAKKAGFTEQQFSNMLNGRRTLRVKHLPTIARALGVSVAEICEAGKPSTGLQVKSSLRSAVPEVT